MKIVRNIFGLILITCMICSVVFAAGCATQGSGSTDATTWTGTETSEPTVLKLGEMWDITSIDPGVSGTVIGEKAAITETLVAANADFTLKPGLAKAWTQVDDRTWIFILRDDVVFHDGTRMTADDVKASLERTIKMDSRVKSMLNADKITVLNSSAIQITTMADNPIVAGVLHYPNCGIIARSSLDAAGNMTKPIGTGPYKFESYNLQTHELIVVKHEQWWGGKVGVDKIIIKGTPDPNTRALMIENGELDFTVDVPYSETDRIDNLPGIVVEKYATPRDYKIDCNLKTEALSDVRVRQAISYAIDRQSIAENVLYNVGQPAAGPFNPSMSWTNKSLKPYVRDVSKAKQLLEAAGWVDTNGDGIREKNGQPLTLSLLTYPARPGLPPMAEAIAAELKDVGIKVTVEIMESGAITQRQAEGKWDLYLIAANVAMVPDPQYVLTNWYTTTGPDNKGGYSNPVVDSKIAEASKIKDLKERYKKFNEVEAIVNEEQPMIIVAYYGCAIVKKDIVKGYVFDPTAHDYAINGAMYVEN